MSLWLKAAVSCAIAQPARAFASAPGVQLPRRGQPDAVRTHLRGVSSSDAASADPSASSASSSYTQTAALAGLCAFAVSASHGLQRRTRRARHGGGRLRSSLRVTSLDTEVAQRSSSMVVRQEEGLEDFDSVETEIAQFVPRIWALQRQAELLRSGELQKVVSAMKDLRKTELHSVFNEVDQLLCALVEAIQNLKESAIQIRRDELQEQIENMDSDAEVFGSLEGTVESLTKLAIGNENDVDTMMEVHVVGLSHHSAPVHMREKLAVPQDQWNSYAQELVEFGRTRHGHLVPEVAVLSTCNRFELYFASPELKKYPAVECVHAFLRQKSGLSREELEPFLFTASGAAATQHLFEVSSGLDSLVLGEAQILAQVKACHEHCIVKADPEDESVVRGYGGKIISKWLNAGIRMGKLARTQTRIGQGAVSVSSAAVELMMAKSLSDLRKYSHNLEVCIVGAGKMSRLLLLALFSKHPDIKLTLVNRSVDKAKALLEEVAPRGGANADVAPTSEMWDVIRRSDVVFTSTASTEPIIYPQQLTDLERNLMLIDISVPLNVAAGCGDVQGVTSYNVDDLKKIQEANNAARQAEVMKAKRLITEQANNFKIWQASQGAVPYLAALQAMAERIRQLEFEKMTYRLKGLHDKEREAVDKLTRHIIDQLFRPIYYSMKDEEDMQTKKSKIWALSKIFKLEPLYKRRNLLESSPAPKQLVA